MQIPEIEINSNCEMKLSSCMLLPLLLRHIISSCMKERSFSAWVPFPFSLSFYFKHFSSGKMQSWWNTHLGITPSLRSSLTVDIFNFNWNIFLYCHMHDEIVVAAWQTFLSIFFKKSKTLCTGTWAMLKFFFVWFISFPTPLLPLLMHYFSLP